MEAERAPTLPETRSSQDIALAYETLQFVQVAAPKLHSCVSPLTLALKGIPESRRG
jgi:hypothetical protein